MKPGYKQTDVGVIPDEWEVCAVRQKGEVVTGKALAVNAPGLQRPYLRTKNVFDGRIDIDDVLTMPMTDEQFTQFQIRNGDVLLNEGQSIDLVGRCALYQNEYPEPCAIQNALLRFRARTGVSEKFASYLFRHCQHTGVFARIALQTTSVAHLGGSRFEALRLAWPTEPEQRAIAKALSDVDGLLDGLDRLIAKKRDLKQATMQQLLTGETRLLGFHGEWKPKRFAELLKYERPDKFLVKSAEYLEQGDTPVLTANKSFILGYTNDEFGIYQNLPVIIFDDFTTDSKYVDFPFKVKSSAIKILKARSPEVNLRFIFSRMQLVNFPLGEHKRYYISEYQHIELPTPEPDEQAAIAEVLTDMDAELAALEQRREKTRALKQAMMQELLTGRTRLVESVARAEAAC